MLMILPAGARDIAFSFRHYLRSNRTITNFNMSHFTFSSKANNKKGLPSMIVFDLDDCLWSPEMHELPGMPTIPVHDKYNGDDNQTIVVGLKVPRYGDTVTLFDGARKVLHELATNQDYQGICLATASSSLEPSYSYACLNAIEIVPGLTMANMMSYNQIGRTGNLTSNKRSHFQLIHGESGIPYNEMIFFDDCNWGDHCGQIQREFGVTAQRTPRGLTWNDFTVAMQTFRRVWEDE